MAHVELTCTLNKPHLPVLKTQQLVYVYIQAQATGEVTAVRNPLNLAMVLDRSGSMEGEKIANLRTAAKQVIDLLDKEDYVSITAFSDRAFKIALPADFDPAADHTLVVRVRKDIAAAGIWRPVSIVSAE